MNCDHRQITLVQIKCRDKSVQYRKLCLECWRSMSEAIPHIEAKQIIAKTGITPGVSSMEQIERAREQYWQRSHSYQQFPLHFATGTATA